VVDIKVGAVLRLNKDSTPDPTVEGFWFGNRVSKLVVPTSFANFESLSGEGENVSVVNPATPVIVSGDVLPKSMTAAFAPPAHPKLAARRAAAHTVAKCFM
jgi:hypothetical protein